MEKQNRTSLLSYFSAPEYALLVSSSILIVCSFLIFDRTNGMTLTASLVGVVSLLLNAKGNPAGQALMVVFSVLYGIISYRCAYWGEMVTYLGMTAPMALYALISWFRHPYQGRISEVEVNRLRPREYALMATLTTGVTVAFFFILRALGTANLPASTMSVTTSFAAVYLTARRSPYYALAYAANDVVLIILWIAAALSDPGYVSVVVCFMAFLANDLYGFIGWRRMERRQQRERR